MRTTKPLAASLALLAAASCLALAPAAEGAQRAKKRAPCSERGRTLARSLEARVYTRITDRDGYEHELVGCTHRGRKRRVLDSWYSCECSVADDLPPRVAALSGRYVAIASSYSCGPPGFPCAGPDLVVFDLRTGRIRHAVEGGGRSGGVLLKRNGSLAYVLEGRLVRVDAAGAVVLDEGAGIDPGSLAAARGRLYWMHGDTPRTATFE
jgi:hypothetical protein